MANTFKIKSNAAMPASAGTFLTLYTVPSSTQTIIIGLTLCNVHTASVTCSVKIDSNTSDVETNEAVKVINDVTIPSNSSLEVLSGGKYVLQTTDILLIDCSVTAKIDATLSILEIT